MQSSFPNEQCISSRAMDIGLGSLLQAKKIFSELDLIMS